MKATKILSVFALALLLVGWGIGPALAQEESEAEDGEAKEGHVFIIDSLDGIGFVDVWEVKCSGLNTFVSANVCDRDDLDDAFTVTVVGLSPGSLKKKADTAFSSPGGCSPFARLDRPFPGSIKALVVISQRFGTATSYDSTMGCNVSSKPPKLKQDQ